VGVGFSYRDDRNYTDNNDENTALRNLAAIQEFYELFPEFKANNLYLSGESYAGVYIPMFAFNILQAQKANSWNGGNLVGILVGNGCTGNTGICSNKCNGMAYEIQLLVEFAYVSPQLKSDIQNYCLKDIQACIATTEDYPGPVSQKCQDLFSNVLDVYYPASDVSGAINPYGVQDICLQNSCPSPNGNTFKDRVGGRLSTRMRTALRNKQLKSLKSTHPFDFSTFQSFSPCMDSAALSSFMNDPNVQRALHVQPLDYCYALCNTPAGWQYTSQDIVLPTQIYPELIPYLKVLIYNGVLDTVVPYTDNYAWTKAMNFSVIDGGYWKTWYYTEQSELTIQTGGYTVEYNISKVRKIPGASFVFQTVANAGHMVPQDTPQSAFEMFAVFVGTSLPVSNTFKMPLPTSSSSSDSSGLSDGEAAGIAIVVILVFGLAIYATWFYSTKRNLNTLLITSSTLSSRS
jgi:carboxypeptidase C (cathepsin A)